MTFANSNFARVTSSANENAQVVWAYKSSADNIATITASAYFNTKILALAIGDVIYIEASDAHRLVRVTSVTTNVTVETFDTYEGSLDLAEGFIYLGDASAKATSIDASTDTQIVVGNGTTVTSVATSGDVTMTNAGVVTIENDAVTTVKILDANVTLAKLAAGITPSHVARFAGKHAYGGGGTSDAATVAGVVAGDIVVAMIESKTNAGYLDLAVPTTDTITFTFSADPGASTVVSYVVFNAAS